MVSATFQRQFQAAIADPAQLARTLFKQEPTEQQLRLFDSITLDLMKPADERAKRAAVRSGKGTGKTFALVVLAFFFALNQVDRWVLITAPTMRQCRNLINEARRLVQAGHPVLSQITNITADKITFFGRPIWKIEALSASRPENLQGAHEKGLVALMDEASGVDDAINETIESTLTNSNSYLIKAGNPNKASGHFYNSFFGPGRDLWIKHQFNAEESPIVDKGNIARLSAQYGKHSDYYRVSVTGDFPLTDTSVVIHRGLLDMQPRHELQRMVDPNHWRRYFGHKHAIGIDPARFGGDESVICGRTGAYAPPDCFKVFVKEETVNVIQAAFEMQHRMGWRNEDTVYVFDATGIGQGLVHHFYQNGKQILPVVFNSKSFEPGFANVITEAWFCVRKMLMEKGIVLVEDVMLYDQLCNRNYDVKNDVYVIEAKKEYVKRFGRSPDRADASILAFYPHTSTDVILPGSQHDRSFSANPFDIGTPLSEPAPPPRSAFR